MTWFRKAYEKVNRGTLTLRGMQRVPRQWLSIIKANRTQSFFQSSSETEWLVLVCSGCQQTLSHGHLEHILKSPVNNFQLLYRVVKKEHYLTIKIFPEKKIFDRF